MKLYKIWQTVNVGYDMYDSAVVAAESMDDARLTHPTGVYEWRVDTWYRPDYSDKNIFVKASWDGWVEPYDVEVKYIGEAEIGTQPGLIVSSFNAG